MAKVINGKLDLSVSDVHAIIDKALENIDEHYTFTIVIGGEYEFEIIATFDEISRDESSPIYGPYYTHVGWRNGELFDYELAINTITGDDIRLTDESLYMIEHAVQHELSYILD